jgi:DNA-binding CsgD family transcriptional regulator
MAPIKDSVHQEMSGLGARIKNLESQVSKNNHSQDKKTFEMEINSAVAELSYSLVTSNATLPGIAGIVLNYAKVFTKSDIGYASSIDPKTGHNICHTLTGMIGDSCKIADYEKGIVFPIRANGRYPALWGHSLNTRTAFYTNSPESHPASEGTPHRHIRLRNFLSVPAIIEDRLYGQISLANTRTGYADYELNGVKRLAAIYALAIQRETDRLRLEKEIERGRLLEKKVVEAREKKNFGSDDLEDANKALKGLLKQRAEEQKETEKKMVLNLNNLIRPYLKKLSQTDLTPRQQVYVEIIKNNINDFISPFITQAKSVGIYLTPQEIQVASLIRSGYQSKDISGLLNISVNSVNFHRKNIRTKFGLKHRQINLRTYLLSFAKL